MTDADHVPRTAAWAGQQLARLHQEIATARAELSGLQVDAMNGAQTEGMQAALLLQANEQLVITALRAQEEADSAAQALEQVARSAELDPLTALPNRVVLFDRLTHAIAVAKRNGSTFSLLFIDIDDFKSINDVFGHAVGDAALQRVAMCLSSAVRDSDTVSRHGGDEFLILLADASLASHAQRTCAAVSSALAAIDAIGEYSVTLSVSIGIAVYPADGSGAQALIDSADAAMYRAKRQRSGSPASHWELASGGEASQFAPVGATTQWPAHSSASLLALQERRSIQQREANGQLLIAALGAQGMLADAERAQKRQTDFMTMLAHELRNPLGQLRVAGHLLSRVQTQEPLMLRLQAVIERQVVNMARLVDDLLDLSRAQTGKLRIECSDIDFSLVLREAIEAAVPMFDRRLQHFAVDVPEGAIGLSGDPLRLAQIMGNLLDNASKYTPEGGQIALHVAVEQDTVVVAVSDTGIGISAETLGEVFEPFVQDAHAVGFNGAGLGIGLAVVRELVHAHGGTVSAHSDGAGSGSRFTVTLRLGAGRRGASQEPRTAIAATAVSDSLG